MPQHPSAAILRNSPGRSNMANYEDIFAGPTSAPSAWDQITGRQVSDDAATALGAGPAFSALRRAFDAQRLNQIDGQLNVESDLLSGRPQRIGRMQHTAANELAGMDSEAEAAREFAPFASALHERDTREANQLATTRHLLPAQVEAEGNRVAADINARGRVDAANARNSQLPLRGLLDALSAIINKTGAPPDEKTLGILKQQFGVQ